MTTAAAHTIPDETMGRHALGYTVNAALSSDIVKKVLEIQSQLESRFGDAIILMPPETLHITLCDWLAPLVDYSDDKDTLFEEKFPEYDRALTDALRIGDTPIDVHFNELRVSPGAIFIVGHDKGEFASIRRDFLERVTLLPDTKQPPVIIHSTIARFRKAIELAPLEDFATSTAIDVNQQVTAFRLNRERVIPMQEYDVVKEYTVTPSP